MICQRSEYYHRFELGEQGFVFVAKESWFIEQHLHGRQVTSSPCHLCNHETGILTEVSPIKDSTRGG
jgi:hypothetical protein